MKNSEKLNEAIGNIDNKMIEAAYERQAEKKSRSGVWQIIGIAASFLFIAAFAVVLSRFTGRQSSVSNPSASSGETEKSVNKNDYEKFNDQGFLYNTEDGLFRFELQTYTADNELFFFTCKLKVTNVSNHDVTLHRCGSCDSFFAFDVNMTRGENSQIISYKGSLDESKKELTLKPGKSHEEYLTNSTPISEAMRTTYLQYLHDVYVDMSVSLDLDPSNNFGWHYTIMHVKGRQFVKSGDVSDTEDTDDNDHNVFVCGDQRVKGLEGFICDSYEDPISGQHIEADGSGISEELISMENPPTLYYKPGDKIDFINDPAQSVNCFQLWDKSGDNTIDFGGDLYNYLKANPGQYYLTAELKQGKRYTSMGVKLVVETVMPADFSFSLVWNTFGISSYDSKTGKLIKTKDTSNIKKYTTKYKMTDEELYKIYDILYNRINIDSYPDDYDPYNAPDAEIRLVSKPSQTVIISVTANGRTKTVTCDEISFGVEGYDEHATEFIKAKSDIVNILTNTDEWQALPDYEFLYD